MYVIGKSVYEDNGRHLATFSSFNVALTMQAKFDKAILKTRIQDPPPTASDLETERKVWQLLELRKNGAAP